MRILTTTIKREFLAAIVAGTKTEEFREVKPYWRHRFCDSEKGFFPPFKMRLINGMSKKAPEVTVLIDAVNEVAGWGQYRLHIKKILEVKNWSISTS